MRLSYEQGEDNSGTSTPTAAVASEDLDFSELKKKKKSAKKKAALDMEAFEKELNESKAKDAEDDEGGEETNLPEVDEAELGDDPFSRAESTGGAVGLEAGNEPWLNSDRDYTYQEVSLVFCISTNSMLIYTFSPFYSSFIVSMFNYTHRILVRSQWVASGTQSHLLKSCVRVTRRPSSRTYRIFASGCTGNPSTSFNTCLLKWEQRAPLMAADGWLSKVASSRSRLSTC